MSTAPPQAKGLPLVNLWAKALFSFDCSASGEFLDEGVDVGLGRGGQQPVSCGQFDFVCSSARTTMRVVVVEVVGGWVGGIVYV